MNPKGVSQAMWIIIALVVALVIALVLITLFSSTSTKAGKNSENSMSVTQSGIDAQMCAELCNSCKLLYGSKCNWNDPKYDKCRAVVPSCVVPSS